MQLFNGATPAAATNEQPSAASQLEIVAARFAAVKPSALVKIEAKVAELREKRAALSKEIAKEREAALSQHQRIGGAMPEKLIAVERKLEALDQDICSARDEMHRRRKEFAEGEFARVATEFRTEVAAEIRRHLPALNSAFHLLDAIDNVSMRNGIEYRSGGTEMRVALQYLNTLV